MTRAWQLADPTTSPNSRARDLVMAQADRLFRAWDTGLRELAAT
jgi:hypothetical protein